MPVKVSLQYVHNISRYLRLCAEIRSSWCARETPRGAEDEIWYRGQPNEQLGLVPKLYRPEFRNASEADIRHEFQSRAIQLIHGGRIPTGKYDWYFLMQHYGAPTRLLDWSANPLVALYFAVETVIKADTRAEGGDSDDVDQSFRSDGDQSGAKRRRALSV